MLAEILLPLSILIVSLHANHTEHISPALPTRYPPRRQSSTGLTVSNINEAVIVSIMARQAELPAPFEVVKPALQLAMERVKLKYPHLRFRLVARKDDNACINNYVGAMAAEEYFLKKVSVFIGPICSLALDPVARMASYWNVPIFTAGGIGIEFSKKSIYSSLTRMAFSLGMKCYFDYFYVCLKRFYSQIVCLTFL